MLQQKMLAFGANKPVLRKELYFTSANRDNTAKICAKATD